jgi:hypothetical protein
MKRRLRRVALLGTILLGCVSTTNVASAAKVIGGFAVVQSDGTVVAKKGVKKVNRTSTGVYLVKFRRPVEGCAFAVQTGNPTPGGGGALDLTSFIRPDLSNSRTLRVDIFRISSTQPFDHGFFVHSVC